MQKLPRSAIKLLELQTVPLAQLSSEFEQLAASPAKLQKEGARMSFLKLLRGKSAPEKSKVNFSPSTAKRSYSIDAVAWLRLGLSGDKPISLCLCYTDVSGEYVAIVDEQRVSDGSSVMLSGRVEIETKGDLKELKVACAGLKDSDRCYVEDLSINRVVEEENVQKSA